MNKIPCLSRRILALWMLLSLQAVAQLDTTITYQGSLSDEGAHADGPYDFEFELWNQSSGGLQFGITHTLNDVVVEKGIFTVTLDFGIYDGSDLWMEIHLRDGASGGSFTTLTPRTQVTIAPQASYADYASVAGEAGPWASGGGNVHYSGGNVGIGTTTPGYPLEVSGGKNPAIRGRSTSAHAVTGYVSNTDGSGIVGVQDGYDPASDGGSFWSPGGFFGGRNGAIGSTNQNSGHGLVGLSMGASGVGNGVYARSANYDAVYARTDRADHNYGLYTLDNIYSLNYNLAGAVMHVVQNGGNLTLNKGDVAVFGGISSPVMEGGPPLVQVALATGANSTAVAGVVHSRFNIDVVTNERERNSGQESTSSREVTPPGPVQPGEYLLLVTQGPSQVKADASVGAIQPGDLLSSANAIGRAAKAVTVNIEGVSTALPGTIFGKALESLEQGEGLIYLFVTLQ